MLTDLNKGMSLGIAYNHLNLPTQVTLPGGNIQYIYDAMGVKLRKTVSRGATTDYAGNFVYENSSLKFFNHSEGYTQPDGSGGFEYVYQYRDHLGNIRLNYADSDGNGTITASSEIIEENNYYPFGLKHKGYNNVINGTEHKWKYNGKELEESLGYDMYDFDMRHYDPAIGRWVVVDPLAEDMRRHSPYNFAFDNPIYFIDPDGMKPFGSNTDPKKILKKLVTADDYEKNKFKSDMKAVLNFFLTPAKVGLNMLNSLVSEGDDVNSQGSGVRTEDGNMMANTTSENPGDDIHLPKQVTTALAGIRGGIKNPKNSANAIEALDDGMGSASKVIESVEMTVDNFSSDDSSNSGSINTTNTDGEVSTGTTSDTATKTVVTRYLSDSDGNNSVVRDTLTPFGQLLVGDVTTISPDRKIDSTTLVDIKVKIKRQE